MQSLNRETRRWRRERRRKKKGPVRGWRERGIIVIRCIHPQETRILATCCDQFLFVSHLNNSHWEGCRRRNTSIYTGIKTKISNITSLYCSAFFVCVCALYSKRQVFGLVYFCFMRRGEKDLVTILLSLKLEVRFNWPKSLLVSLIDTLVLRAK